jgi:hypothetical protein
MSMTPLQKNTAEAHGESPLCLTIEQFCRKTGIGRTMTYARLEVWAAKGREIRKTHPDPGRERQ